MLCPSNDFNFISLKFECRVRVLCGYEDTHCVTYSIAPVAVSVTIVSSSSASMSRALVILTICVRVPIDGRKHKSTLAESDSGIVLF